MSKPRPTLAQLMPAKVLYLWERFRLRRIELFTTDTEKKPEIPQSKFAKVHQRILDERKKHDTRNR